MRSLKGCGVAVCVLVPIFWASLLTGCTASGPAVLLSTLERVIDGCGGTEQVPEESYVPQESTQHWKSWENVARLDKKLGIYMDIRIDERGVFNGQIGNYVYNEVGAYGSIYTAGGGYFTTGSELKKPVCGRLNFTDNTGIVWPDGEDKTPVTVEKTEDKLIITFIEWPTVDPGDPPGATLWKMAE